MLKKVIFNRAQLVRCARRAGKKRIDISQKEEEGGKISIGLYLNSYLPCHVNAKGPRYSSGSLGAPPGESFSNGLNKNNWPLMNGGHPPLVSFPALLPLLSKEESRTSFPLCRGWITIYQTFPIYLCASGFSARYSYAFLHIILKEKYLVVALYHD